MLAHHIQVLAMLVPSFTLVVFTAIRRRQRGHFRRRCFLTRHLPRSPGESVRIELENLSGSISAYIAVTFTIPLVVYSAFPSAMKERTTAGVVSVTVDAVAVAACAIYAVGKLLSLIKRRHRLAMELEARMAVAQELNALAHEGYRVFHDFPAAGFSIAHVVVGKTGVYALETRAFTMPNANDGEASWDVIYSGNSLTFPGGQETRAVEQAAFHAAWLKTWLSGALGEHVPVHPVLVIPGWYVKRSCSDGIRVSNGKDFRALLGSPEPDHHCLSGKIIQYIADQFGRRCRQRAAGPAPDLLALGADAV